MKEYEFPKDMQIALDDLNNIINKSKSVPFNDTNIIVDKNELREIHTKIYREINRIMEIRNTCLANAKQEANEIIKEANEDALKIKELSLMGSSELENLVVKEALEFKNNVRDHLISKLKSIDSAIKQVDSVKNQIKKELDHMDKCDKKNDKE